MKTSLFPACPASAAQLPGAFLLRLCRELRVRQLSAQFFTPFFARLVHHACVGFELGLRFLTLPHPHAKPVPASCEPCSP